MRNATLIALLLAHPGLLPASADCTEEDIALAGLPPAVVRSAQQAVPGITLSEAEQMRDGKALVYELEGYVDGKEYEISVNANGEVLEVEEDD